jgi:hypothetical protein
MTPANQSQGPEMPQMVERQPLLSVEKIKKLLDLHERDDSMIEAQITDVQQESELAKQIAEKLSDPKERKNYPFLPEDNAEILKVVEGELVTLREYLRTKEEVLLEKAKKFKDIEKDPQKKSLMGKALDAVKKGLNFTWRHKWKILIGLAVIAGGVAGWYYKDALLGLLGLRGFGFGAGAGEGAGTAAAEGAAEAGAEGAATAGGSVAEGTAAAAEESGAVAEIAEGVTNTDNLGWKLVEGWAKDGNPANNVLKIATKGGEVVEVNGTQYSVDTFEKLFENWSKGKDVQEVIIDQYGSSLPKLETRVMNFLHSQNVSSRYTEHLLRD